MNKNKIVTTILDLYDDETILDIDTIFKEHEQLQQENKQLNKRIKELEDGFKAVNDELCEYAEEKENLIKYLEDELKKDANITKLWKDRRFETLKEILEKVKGGKYE